MKIFVVKPPPRKGLNMRQLLNPLFFSPVAHHPDATRQRGARLKAKDLTAARRLKAQYVPLCRVDRTVWIRADWTWHADHPTWRMMEVPK